MSDFSISKFYIGGNEVTDEVKAGLIAPDIPSTQFFFEISGSPRKNYQKNEQTKMDDLVVEDMKVVPCVNSKYVQPSRLQFTQNGVNREWDYINVHDSVAALLLNTTRNEFILVKQFRPAVYMRKNRQLQEATGEDKTALKQDTASTSFQAAINDAVTYELCAGIIDKNIPLKSIVKEEVLEECGYDVPEGTFEEVYTAWGSVGFAGTVQTLFYAEVTDNMKLNEGGGNRSEGEKIEVFYLQKDKVQEFLFDASLPKPPSLLAAFFWYLNTKDNVKEK